MVFCAIFTKIPIFPFSFWLPEAHVEASWPGSVFLAGFSLKFATIASTLFLVASGFLLGHEAIVVLGILSGIVGTIAISSTADLKKIVANLSIVHMSATFLLLISANQNSENLLNFSWHHHSIIAGMLFAIIGVFYVTSGSRILRLLSVSSENLFVFSLVLFVAMTFSLDLPWTSNIAIEISFAQIALLKFSGVVLLQFVVLF